MFGRRDVDFVPAVHIWDVVTLQDDTLIDVVFHDFRDGVRDVRVDPERDFYPVHCVGSPAKKSMTRSKKPRPLFCGWTSLPIVSASCSNSSRCSSVSCCGTSTVT